MSDPRVTELRRACTLAGKSRKKGKPAFPFYGFFLVQMLITKNAHTLILLETGIWGMSNELGKFWVKDVQSITFCKTFRTHTALCTVDANLGVSWEYSVVVILTQRK